MKYIKTKDKVLKVRKPFEDEYTDNTHIHCYEHPMVHKRDIIKSADAIEELCDMFVLFRDNKPYAIVPNKEHNAELSKNVWKDYYGAIWTDKGLIYVAKMNDKGELELL